jgi:ATP-binding cassette, subfamily B, bacterial
MIRIGGPNDPTTRKTWRERWQNLRRAFRNLPRAFRLVWQASRPGTIVMALITLVAAGLPAAQAWTGKLIVDSVVAALGAQLAAAEALRLALPYILLEFGLITASELLSEGRALLHRLLSNRLMHTINVSIIRKALALDLHFFEDATFYDKLQNARQEASWRSLEMVDTCFSLAQNVITLLSFLAILLTFSPLLTLLLLFATLPAFIARIRNSNEFYGFRLGHTPESRRMRYLEHLLTTDNTIKEIKLFNLGEPLLRRYQELFRSYDREDYPARREAGAGRRERGRQDHTGQAADPAL